MNKLIKSILILLTLSMCLIQSVYSQELIKDELADSLKTRQLSKPPVNDKYDYKDTKKIRIELSVIADINSEKDIYEGQTIVFRVLNDVWYKGRCLAKKGELVYAKVETIISSGMNGIPASIIFGDFKFNNIEKNQLIDTYETYGQDRSLWVYPLKWALTILPPTGSLTNFIKGGHAKLKTNDVVEIYVCPNW